MRFGSGRLRKGSIGIRRRPLARDVAAHPPGRSGRNSTSIPCTPSNARGLPKPMASVRKSSAGYPGTPWCCSHRRPCRPQCDGIWRREFWPARPLAVRISCAPEGSSRQDGLGGRAIGRRYGLRRESAPEASAPVESFWSLSVFEEQKLAPPLI